MSSSEPDKGPFGITIPFGLSSTLFYVICGVGLLLVLIVLYFLFFKKSESNPDDMALY